MLINHDFNTDTLVKLLRSNEQRNKNIYVPLSKKIKPFMFTAALFPYVTLSDLQLQKPILTHTYFNNTELTAIKSIPTKIISCTLWMFVDE